MSNPDFLFDLAYTCLHETDPAQKCKLSHAAAEKWNAGLVQLQASQDVVSIPIPGRPTQPVLVAPRELSRRSTTSPEGLAALIHALCHIEFNAINLAWDAVYRFREMPEDFYSDWIRVAEEESYHFQLLRAHLQGLGYDYGDFPAHNGLWEMALATDQDPMVRMALVPRVLEARGLDATPGIQRRLREAGDDAAVAILDIVQRDEIGHVAVGTRWFRYCCEQRGLAPSATFFRLLREHMKGRIRAPMAREAREAAGFSQEELDYLEAMI